MLEGSPGVSCEGWLWPVAQLARDPLAGSYQLVCQEGPAQDNEPDEIVQPAFCSRDFSEDSVDAGTIADLEFTSQGVGHQFLGQAAPAESLSIEEEFAKFRKGVKRTPVGECSGGIDRNRAVILVPPSSNGVEVVQREAEGVDLTMTLCTGALAWCFFNYSRIVTAPRMSGAMAGMFEGGEVR